MANSWRLILTPPASGAFNMALDEALLITTSKKMRLTGLTSILLESSHVIPGICTKHQ